MVVFAGNLLKWSAWTTIIHLCTLVPLFIKFYGLRVRKFTSVVGKQNRKKPDKNVRAKLEIYFLKDIYYRLGVIGVPEKCQLQFLLHKVYREKNFSSPYSFYRIQLTYGCIRMFLKIGLKLFPCSADATGLINFQISFLIFSWAHSYCAWHINISCRKKSLIDIGV